MKRSVRHTVVLSLVTAWAMTGLWAQRPLDSMQYLKPVKVQARQKTLRMENTVTPVQAMQGIELQRLHLQQAGEALKRFAGVNVKDYGGVGGMKTVSVRSLGAAHTAVAYDGILLSDAQNGQIDLGKIYLDQVKTVALYNGQGGNILQPARNFSAASLLGLDTYGWADYDSMPPFSAAFSFGSFGLVSPSFGFRRKLSPKVGISAHARYDYIYGNYPFDLDLGGTVQHLKRGNADIQSGNTEVNLNYQPSDRHRLDLKLFYFGSDRGLPGAVIYYSAPGVQRLEDQNVFGVLKHTWQIAPRWVQKNALKYNFMYNRFTDPESLSVRQVDERYRQQEVYLSTATLYNTPVSGLSFSGSLDAAFHFLRSNQEPFPDPYRSSLWFNVAGNYTHRYVEVVLNGLTSAFFDRVGSGPEPGDKVRFSPFASVAVFPLGNRSLAIRFYYKDIFRMPTFNDLYYSRIGNTGLKPEQARQIDAGVSYTFPVRGNRLWHVEVSADIYRNWVKDKIVAYPTTNLFVWSMLNVDRVEITGLDAVLQAGSAFARSGLASRFRLDLQASYTLQNALDRTDPKGAVYNHQIAYTPRHSGSASLMLGMPYVTLTYRLVFSGERYALNENIAANRLSPYVEHSIGADVRFRLWRTDFELGFDWLNFTGESYEIVLNYPMPKAHYRVHLRCRF